MIESGFMLDSETGQQIQIKVDDQTLEKICDEVRRNVAAMDALNLGYQNTKAALQRGDISSPVAPLGYATIYEIMNKFDERYAGTVGNKIIRFLEKQLI